MYNFFTLSYVLIFETYKNSRFKACYFLMQIPNTSYTPESTSRHIS